eukprot:GHVT01058242.1.p1 GENE.GHVT01058242.1~~GHVT01058242.1.p1  ORF type:complete len:207 (+),score=14.50 GHVT01058242.1:2-622(+)
MPLATANKTESFCTPQQIANSNSSMDSYDSESQDSCTMVSVSETSLSQASQDSSGGVVKSQGSEDSLTRHTVDSLTMDDGSTITEITEDAGVPNGEISETMTEAPVDGSMVAIAKRPHSPNHHQGTPPKRVRDEDEVLPAANSPMQVDEVAGSKPTQNSVNPGLPKPVQNVQKLHTGRLPSGELPDMSSPQPVPIPVPTTKTSIQL